MRYVTILLMLVGCGSGTGTISAETPDAEPAESAATVYPNCGPGIIYSFNGQTTCCNASIHTLDQDPVSICGDITVDGSVYARCDCPTGTVCHGGGTQLQCAAP